MEFASIFVKNSNIAEELIAKGYAKVNMPKGPNDESS